VTVPPAAGVPGTRARAGRDVARQIVLRATNIALGVGVTLLLVRSLGDEGFGQWATLLAVVGFAGYFGEMGLDRVAVERAAARPQTAASWLGGLIGLRLALTVPAAVTALAICLWLSDTAPMRAAAVVLTVLVPIAAIGSARVAFQLQVRNAVAVAVELANGILWAAAVVVVAVLDGGLVAYAAAFVAVSAATSLVQLALALRTTEFRLRGSRARWRTLLRLGVPVGVGGLLTFGYGYIDQVIVFAIAGARDAGLYGAVYRIYERIQFLPAAVMTTLFPIFVAARAADPARVRRLFQLAFDALVLLSLPALTIVLAGPEQIVRLLFGPEFTDAAPALPLLMATFVLVSVGYLAGYLIIAYELQRRFVLIALVALVLNVTANLVFVPIGGFMAAAWITLGTELLVATWTTVLVCRTVGVLPPWGRVARVAAVALAAGIAAWVLRQAGVPVVLWASAAAGLYGASLLGFGMVGSDELRSLFRREPEPLVPQT
jgi:O-antigen/teichoic acid export membrane protein